MRFSDWRKGQGYTQQQAAEALGVTQPVISQLEADDPKVRGGAFVLAISKLTRGAVTPNDIYALPPIEQLELPDLAARDDAPLFADAGDQ